jgi:thiol-disulfide isomerase/thioredoxin
MNQKRLLVLLAILLIINILTICRFCMKNLFFNESMTNVDTNQPNNKIKVTLYYASWCGWSKKFLPEWDSFVKHASKNMANISTEKVSCENGTEQECKGIQGYPTVLIYINNKVITYDGERTASELANYCAKL